MKLYRDMTDQERQESDLRHNWAIRQQKMIAQAVMGEYDQEKQQERDMQKYETLV